MTAGPTDRLGAFPALDHPSLFMRDSGFVIEQISGVRVTGHLLLGPDQHTPWGIVHGGVYATAAESAASLGACAAVADRGQHAVGVTNSTDFLRPMVEGRVEVLAEPVTQGRTQQLWQVAITRSDNGKLVARSTVRLQNLPVPPAARG